MRLSWIQLILFVFLISNSIHVVGQFELKSGIGASRWQSQVGGHIEAAYVSSEIFTVGLFGSYGKVFSYLDRNHILATGVVMEVRGRFTQEMTIIPLLNFHLGRSWEYKNIYYTYGSEHQYSNNIDKHVTGFSMAVRAGMISNFNKTNRLQFQFDVGLLQQSFKVDLDIFSTQEPIIFLEARLMLVYSF